MNVLIPAVIVFQFSFNYSLINLIKLNLILGEVTQEKTNKQTIIKAFLTNFSLCLNTFRILMKNNPVCILSAVLVE